MLRTRGLTASRSSKAYKEGRTQGAALLFNEREI